MPGVGAGEINLTPTELTRRILAGSIGNIEPSLEFTFETCDQFGGWLPTKA